MIGRYTSEGQKIKQLEKDIKVKEKELHDMEMNLVNVLSEIRSINESNSYNAPEIQKRKISELCSDTIYALLINRALLNKKRTITTDQSNK